MAKFLVTAGSTREYLDDVRFLTNGSSGRMGYAIAEAALQRGHRVALVSGPTHLEPPAGAEVHSVVTADEMLAAARQVLQDCDIVIGVAAVADWRPAARAPGKPARTGERLMLELVANPDVLATLAAHKGRRVHVGFALEAPQSGGSGDSTAAWDAALARARRKLAAKGLDLIVVNLTHAVERDASEAVLLWRSERVERLPRQAKSATAARIVEAALALMPGEAGPAVGAEGLP